MFWKLFKFELNSAYRNFGLFYAILFASAALIGIGSVLPETNLSFFTQFFLSMSAVFYSAMLIAINILTVVFIIGGYNKSMYKRNAYLTHTLPVSAKQLMLVKILSALFWILMTGLIEFLTVFVIMIFSLHMEEITIMLGSLPKIWAVVDKAEFFLVLFGGLSVLLAAISLLYFVVNFIHSAFVQRGRIVIAILFIIVVEMLESLFLNWFDTNILRSLWDVSDHAIIIATGVYYLIMLGVWFCGSVYLLEHKMEVE